MNRFHAGARPVASGTSGAALLLRREREIGSSRMTRWATRLIAVSSLVGLALITSASVAGAQTSVYAGCVDDAAEEFATCVDEHAWYVAPLCAAVYASDAELCVGPAISAIR